METIASEQGGRIDGSFATALEDTDFFRQEVPIPAVCRGNCISFASAGAGPAGDMVVACPCLLREGRMVTLRPDAAISARSAGEPAGAKPFGWWKAATAGADTFERRG